VRQGRHFPDGNRLHVAADHQVADLPGLVGPFEEVAQNLLLIPGDHGVRQAEIAVDLVQHIFLGHHPGRQAAAGLPLGKPVKLRTHGAGGQNQVGVPAAGGLEAFGPHEQVRVDHDPPGNVVE
jgi:hypothetical protein